MNLKVPPHNLETEQAILGSTVKWFRIFDKQGIMRKIAVNAKPARRVVPFTGSTQARVLDVYTVHKCEEE